MAASVEIKDLATPALKRLEQSVKPGQLNPVIGRAGTNLVRNHFFKINSQRPNKLGGTRTNFFAQAARSTQFQVMADGVVVSINQVGIRQRYFGGKIVPKRAKMLTIAAHPRAYGKRAREFNNLRFAILGGKPALVEARATEVSIGRQRKDGSRSVSATASRTGLVPYFWLVREVNQKPDPSIIPTKADFEAEINKVAESYIQRQIQRGGGNNA